MSLPISTGPQSKSSCDKTPVETEDILYAFSLHQSEGTNHGRATAPNHFAKGDTTLSRGGFRLEAKLLREQMVARMHTCDCNQLYVYATRESNTVLQPAKVLSSFGTQNACRACDGLGNMPRV